MPYDPETSTPGWMDRTHGLRGIQLDRGSRGGGGDRGRDLGVAIVGLIVLLCVVGVCLSREKQSEQFFNIDFVDSQNSHFYLAIRQEKSVSTLDRIFEFIEKTIFKNFSANGKMYGTLKSENESIELSGDYTIVFHYEYDLNNGDQSYETTEFVLTSVDKLWRVHGKIKSERLSERRMFHYLKNLEICSFENADSSQKRDEPACSHAASYDFL